jgi:8-oxo-dGTP pyrophosphatase MutT (NUDIX family)
MSAKKMKKVASSSTTIRSDKPSSRKRSEVAVAETVESRFKAAIQQRKIDLTSEQVSGTQFLVFLSFDLVNSTLYKSQNPAEWPIATQKFYEFVEDALRKRIGDDTKLRLWKYVGDELLLYWEISSLKELRTCLPAAHHAMRRTEDRLGMLFPDSKSILAIKTTVWCAKVGELPPAALDVAKLTSGARDGQSESPVYENIVVKTGFQNKPSQPDFLGPDIDIGFRIARHALKHRVLVSADLAYLLYRDRASDDTGEQGLRLVTFEPLKGVWGGRRYPILWFEPDWSTVDASFEYDEQFESPVVRRILGGETLMGLSQIVKVMRDVNRAAKVESLWDFVSGLQPGTASLVSEASTASMAGLKELHCAAVCFRNDGQVLIAKRPRSKGVLPGCWEFGCGQIEPFESIGDCIDRAYYEDFGARLEHPANVIPIATYTVERGVGFRFPGLIVIAELTNEHELKCARHEEILWVDPLDPHLPDGALVVPDFHEVLKRAAQIRASKQ